jgi:hypothetical protein
MDQRRDGAEMKTLQFPIINVHEWTDTTGLGGDAHLYIVEIQDGRTYKHRRFTAEFKYWDDERKARAKCYRQLGKWLGEEVQEYGRQRTVS